MTIADESTYFVEESAADIAGPAAAAMAANHNAVTAQSAAPRRIKTVVSAATDASGYGTLALPIVPQGFRDIIHNVIIGGPQFGGSAPGVATLYVRGSGHFGDTSITTADVVDYAPVLPNVGFYQDDGDGEGELVVQQGTLLAAQLYDSTLSASSYVMVVRYTRWPNA